LRARSMRSMAELARAEGAGILLFLDDLAIIGFSLLVEVRQVDA
jgi:hypothetical protein